MAHKFNLDAEAIETYFNKQTKTETKIGPLTYFNGTRFLKGVRFDGCIFLYLTESASGDSVKNRIYKYQWNGAELTNPSLILDLPGLPGPNHDGGKILIGPSPNQTGHYLYAVIGDLNHDGKLQNFKDGPSPDDTSVIIRVNPNDGSAPKGNPFPNDDLTSRYWAYGVRNSFGLAIDPITHNL